MYRKSTVIARRLTENVVESVAASVATPVVAVVVPCYKVRDRVLDVLSRIGPEASAVFCVDDGCPEGTGNHIAANCSSDPRIRVIFHEQNRGVGGAMCTGYTAALEFGADVIVKIDGDGQMDPRLIPSLIAPILDGDADYVKGNRFFSIETVRQMSASRVIGNAGLSFLTKLSTGYWDLFDPTNGFTAIAASVARELPLEKIHKRFFFESDMLFRLGTVRARIVELPMMSFYDSGESNLSEVKALLTFPFLHLRNFMKRVAYSYFLRGFSAASLNLVFGLGLVAFGGIFGTVEWIAASQQGVAATPGTVMLAALPVLLGIQMLLAFLSYDVAMVPKRPIHPQIERVQVLKNRD
jgi:dolichol-phosphate mannosyltransferase